LRYKNVKIIKITPENTDLLVFQLKKKKTFSTNIIAAKSFSVTLPYSVLDLLLDTSISSLIGSYPPLN
jgi:hypothetical protein